MMEEGEGKIEEGEGKMEEGEGMRGREKGRGWRGWREETLK